MSRQLTHRTLWLMDIGTRDNISMYVGCGLYLGATDCFVRTVMVVASAKWVCLVQFINTIEIVMAGEATDEGFHACFATDLLGAMNRLWPGNFFGWLCGDA